MESGTENSGKGKQLIGKMDEPTGGIRGRQSSLSKTVAGSQMDSEIGPCNPESLLGIGRQGGKSKGNRVG